MHGLGNADLESRRKRDKRSDFVTINDGRQQRRKPRARCIRPIISKRKDTTLSCCDMIFSDFVVILSVTLIINDDYDCHGLPARNQCGDRPHARDYITTTTTTTAIIITPTTTRSCVAFTASGTPEVYDSTTVVFVLALSCRCRRATTITFISSRSDRAVRVFGQFRQTCEHNTQRVPANCRGCVPMHIIPMSYNPSNDYNIELADQVCDGVFCRDSMPTHVQLATLNNSFRNDWDKRPDLNVFLSNVVAMAIGVDE
ncbi:hypothetical protein QTP88_028252 [Uroleucon formosanum]